MPIVFAYVHLGASWLSKNDFCKQITYGKYKIYQQF